MKWFLLLAASFCLGACAEAQEGDLAPDIAKQVMAAFQAEDFDTVIAKTGGIGNDSKWIRVRATSLQRRGESRFFEGKIADSIADFDAFIAIYPDQDPHHWQRGLCYYYAGEYEKGKAQFERHQTVNTQDVENAVWHFLCAVRAPGGNLEAAGKALIPIEEDSRIPMKAVHDLFGGRGNVEAVLEAAKPDSDGVISESERNHLCYAHLYLGLYFEALGEAEKSAEHIRLAAFEYPMDHYMGKTAQVHAKLRGLTKP
ncbi:MAG TPA: hypothetical protein PK529_12640 [Verrucomicrobiales bacterium]|nr:hypothetical protein [Verrucomicrobiales bacterium]